MKNKLRSASAIVICAVPLLFILPAQAQIPFSDNFNDGNDTTPAWTHLSALFFSSGQTWSAATGAYQLTAPANGPNVGFGNLGFVGSIPTGVSITDGTVQSDVISFAAPGAFGIGARLNNIYIAYGMTGYAFVYEPYASNIELMWLGGAGVLNTLGTKPVTLIPGNQYTMTLAVNGSSIVGSVYQAGGGLLQSVSATDTHYASGFVGVLGIAPAPAAPVDVTMDNFVVPEPGGAVLVGLGLAGLIAVRRRNA